MSIHATCPHCKTAMWFPDEEGGSFQKCGKCGKEVMVPLPTAAPEPPSMPAAPEVSVRCAACGHVLQGPPRLFRVPIPCPQCREVVQFVPVESAAEAVKRKRSAAMWVKLAVVVLLAAGGAFYLYARGTADDEAFAAAQQEAGAAGNDVAEALAAYRKYLGQRPSGRHADEANRELRKLDDSAFASAEAGDRSAGKDFAKAADAYRAYLSVFPDGVHSATASDRIENELPRRAEGDAFVQTQAAVTAAGDSTAEAIEAYKAYLKAFPRGRNANKVSVALARLPRLLEQQEFDKIRAEAEAAGEDYAKAINVYKGFLAKFPKGKNAEAAKRSVEVELPLKWDDQEFAEAQALAAAAEIDVAKVAQECSDYLAKFPDGKHAQEVKALADKMAARARLSVRQSEEDRSVLAVECFWNRTPPPEIWVRFAPDNVEWPRNVTVAPKMWAGKNRLGKVAPRMAWVYPADPKPCVAVAYLDLDRWAANPDRLELDLFPDWFCGKGKVSVELRVGGKVAISQSFDAEFPPAPAKPQPDKAK